MLVTVLTGIATHEPLGAGSAKAALPASDAVMESFADLAAPLGLVEVAALQDS